MKRLPTLKDQKVPKGGLLSPSLRKRTGKIGTKGLGKIKVGKMPRMKKFK